MNQNLRNDFAAYYNAIINDGEAIKMSIPHLISQIIEELSMMDFADLEELDLSAEYVLARLTNIAGIKSLIHELREKADLYEAKLLICFLHLYYVIQFGFEKEDRHTVTRQKLTIFILMLIKADTGRASLQSPA